MLSEMKNLAFASYTLDLGLRQLREGPEVLPVTGKAFDLLAYMASNPGRPLLKSELLSAVWPDSFVEESNLSQNVFLLRKVLGSGPDSPILTLPGRGYQFAAQVTVIPAPSRVGQTAEPGMATLEATQTRMVLEEETEEHIPPWRSAWVVSLAGVGLALLAAVGWLGWQRYEDRVGGPPVQVVLADFDGGTGDPVLDRTLKDVLRIELGQSPFVTVVPAATGRQMLVQMMKKADDPMPGAVAREVCERTGSQAVVQGSVAHLGNGFVVTEEASNCTDGTSLGAANKTVDKPEKLPAAVEMLAGSLRHSLGESRRTIARFNAPLAPMTTDSLEALEDYSQATELSAQSRNADAIGLLKQAVALDPQFAAAWLDLSSYAANSLDIAASKGYLEKAYAVRDQATAPTRLMITARYTDVVTGDLYEAERNYRTWVEMYPRRVQPWSGLANLYVEMGRNDEFLMAARKMLELAPKQLAAYQAVADALIRNGDFQGSKMVLMTARSRGFDGQNLRFLLLRLGYLTGDAGLIAEQEAWVKEHPDSPVMLANLATYAQDHGANAGGGTPVRRDGHRFCAWRRPYSRKENSARESDGLSGVGREELGRKVLHMGPAQLELADLIALAETGDGATARAMLAQQLAEYPRDTAWHQFYAPALNGEFAMLAGKPEDAVNALEQVRAFDMRAADPMYLRGRRCYRRDDSEKRKRNSGGCSRIRGLSRMLINSQWQRCGLRGPWRRKGTGGERRHSTSRFWRIGKTRIIAMLYWQRSRQSLRRFVRSELSLVHFSMFAING